MGPAVVCHSDDPVGVWIGSLSLIRPGLVKDAIFNELYWPILSVYHSWISCRGVLGWHSSPPHQLILLFM